MTAYSGSTKDVKDIIAPCYYDLHRDIREHGHIFYNLPGGRGSCKSSFASIEIVLGIMRDKTGQSNAIVFRLVAGTLRESVFSQGNGETPCRYCKESSAKQGYCGLGKLKRKWRI